MVMPAIHPVERAVVHRLHAIFDRKIRAAGNFLEQIEHVVRHAIGPGADGIDILKSEPDIDIAGMARAHLGRERPKVALLNVGSEELKGNDAVRGAAQILRSSNLPIAFHGFVEGNDIGRGTVDVVAGRRRVEHDERARAAFPQGRQIHGNHIEPIIEVGAEPALVHHVSPCRPSGLRLDVLVHPEEVARVVLALERQQAGIIPAIGGAYALGGIFRPCSVARGPATRRVEKIPRRVRSSG